MSHWRDFRLLRVVAPAGFGKSTLGAQWMEACSREDATTITLALTSTDRDEQRFLQRLHAALSGTASKRLIATPAPSFESIEALLIQHRRPVLVLLDDVHEVDDSETIAILQRLLNDGPPHLHLALFSRTRPNLQIRRWQLEGLVLSLGIEDLRFDHEEFTSFAAGCRLSNLDVSQLEKIEQRYAGWPAGLQLLLQALPATLAITDAHLHGSANNTDFLDYLEKDALQNTPESEREFLVHTSLLPYLNASLCRKLDAYGSSEFETLLMRIADHNGLIVASATQSHSVCYRVHPVLRRFLLQQLSEQTTTSRMREMRRECATALAEEGDVNAALELLLPTRFPAEEAIMLVLGDDVDAAADLVQAASRDEIWRGDSAAVQRWTAQLPRAAIVARPPLAVEAAWAAHHSTQVDTQGTLSTMRAALADHASEDDLRAEALVLEAIEMMRHGRMEACAAHLRDARAVCQDPDGRAAGYIEGIEACTMLTSEPRPLTARLQQLDIAMDIFARNGYTRGRLDAINQAIWISRSYADAYSVIATARRALDHYAVIGWQHTLYAIYAHLHMGEMLYYLDRIEEARASYLTALSTAELTGISQMMAYDMRLRLQLCDIAEGRTADDVDDDEDLREWENSRRRFSPTLATFTGYRRILRDMRLGRLEQCWSTVESLGVQPLELDASHQMATWLCVLAGTRFSNRTDHARDEFVRLVQQAQTYADARSQYWLSLHMKLLLVLHARHCGDITRAQDLLQPLATEVLHTGMLRLLLDFPELNLLLQNLDTEEARRVLARAQYQRTPPSLTSQEMRIMNALAEGMSTRRIATDLVISIETARTHIRNILKKLGVSTREDAVRIARQAQIVR